MVVCSCAFPPSNILLHRKPDFSNTLLISRLILTSINWAHATKGVAFFINFLNWNEIYDHLLPDPWVASPALRIGGHGGPRGASLAAAFLTSQSLWSAARPYPRSALTRGATLGLWLAVSAVSDGRAGRRVEVRFSGSRVSGRCPHEHRSWNGARAAGDSGADSFSVNRRLPPWITATRCSAFSPRKHRVVFSPASAEKENEGFFPPPRRGLFFSLRAKKCVSQVKPNVGVQLWGRDCSVTRAPFYPRKQDNSFITLTIFFFSSTSFFCSCRHRQCGYETSRCEWAVNLPRTLMMRLPSVNVRAEAHERFWRENTNTTDNLGRILPVDL